MKLNMVLLIALVGIGGLPFAAAGPDFSGTWLRIADQSDPLAVYVDGKSQPGTADLVVKHEKSMLWVEKRWSHKPAAQIMHVIDGDEHTGTADGGGTLVYRAVWEGGKLIINGTTKANTPFGSTEIKAREEWSLSEDGKTLTILLTVSTSRGDIKTKQVYCRR
jgi:hypothetical protein